MRVTVLPDAAAAAAAAAAWIAGALREDLATRGASCCAFSGGGTPRAMLAALGAASLDWSRLQVFQVDERVAPRGDGARNLDTLRGGLTALPPRQLHAMPVEAGDLEAAARDYAARLARHAGTPARLDLVHLGLGDDGHTASLFAGDAASARSDVDVAITGLQRGYRRMTLTRAALSRARRRVWLVCGADKAGALAVLLRDGDRGRDDAHQRGAAGGDGDAPRAARPAAPRPAGSVAAYIAQPGDLLFADAASTREMR